MKTIYFLCLFLLGTFALQSQNQNRVKIEWGDRVPEAPQTHPGGINIDPVIPTRPVPPLPPSIVTTPPEVTHQHERKVFFIPGFGGVRSRWSRAVQASEDGDGAGFSGRKCDPTAFSYLQNGGIDLAASDVALQIVSNTATQEDSLKPQNFLIGHSQGGLVAKKLVQRDECDNEEEARGLYGGIVTVNSSLGGAQILQSREDGLFHALSEVICRALSHELLVNVPDIILNIAGLNEFGNFTGSTESICDIFSFNEQGLSVIDFAFAGLTQPISKAYTPGSPELEEINGCDGDSIAKVAIYGVEPYTPLPDAPLFANPIFYRTVQHFFSDVNTDGFWTANDDSKLAIKAQELAFNAWSNAAMDRAKAQAWYSNAINLSIPNWLRIIALNRYEEFSERANAHIAVYQLYHDINLAWMGLIGALDEVAVQTSPNLCKCTIELQSGGIETVVNEVNSSEECSHPDAINCSFIAGQTTINMEYLPSDGVVLASSAMHMTGADVGAIIESEPDPFDNELNTGSSHMQARNDRNLKYSLTLLYDGLLHPFFYIEPKQ